jgi:ParB family transcriptional regulator, chromosome partitioning protein
MTRAAGNVATHPEEKEREKVEKRRALGRGLASLLGGPRAVAGIAGHPAATPAVDVSGDAETRAAVIAQGGSVPHAAVAVPVPPLLQARPGVVEMISAAAEEKLPTAVEERLSAKPAASFDDTLAAVHSAGAQATSAPHMPAADEDITFFAQGESRVAGTLVVNLAIENIDRNPFQTRHVPSDGALEELTNSIKANGVLQPIVVRPAQEDGRYILILGERRLHAARLAGKATIPAMVRHVSQQQAAEMTIIENLQREDLSPLEQAQAFRVLSEEFKLTQAQIGERVGLSRESVANYMRLLRLPPEVMQLLAEKKINFAEAKELLKLETDDQITKAALCAVKKGMTVEQVERLVLQMIGLDAIPGQEKKKGAARWVDPNVRAQQMELERLLGVRVKIRDRKGKGKIIIEYSTVDDYERVVGMLRGKQ